MIYRPGDLTGERGLLAAVIAQATRDAVKGNTRQRADARRYFASGVYERHVTSLGLPADMLPESISEAVND